MTCAIQKVSCPFYFIRTELDKKFTIATWRSLLIADRNTVKLMIDELRAEKATVVAEMDAMISEKNAVISEKDAMISEKDAEIKELKSKLAEADK